MTFPKDYPLESFDPRLDKILKRGARGENFTIRCNSESQANRLQHMLHSFRNRARKYFGDTEPERWKTLYQAVVARMNDENGKKTIVHVFSRQNEFDDVLSGIVPDKAPRSTDPLDEFFPSTAKPEGSGG